MIDPQAGAELLTSTRAEHARQGIPMTSPQDATEVALGANDDEGRTVRCDGCDQQFPAPDVRAVVLRDDAGFAETVHYCPECVAIALVGGTDGGLQVACVVTAVTAGAAQ